MIKCEQCGVENLDGAKFCSSCGAKLENNSKSYKCSSCGKVFSGEKQYCDNCGSKLIYSTNENEAFALPIRGNKSKENNASKEKNRNLFSFISNIIVSALLILVCAFAIGSIFGDFVVVNTNVSSGSYSINASLGFTFWFKEGWEIYKDSLDKTSGVLFILSFISFLCAFGLTLTFGVISIVNLIKCLVRKEKFNSNLLITATLIAPLQYFIFAFANLYTTEKSGRYFVGTVMGSGEVLLIFAISIYILVKAYQKVADGIINKNLNIAKAILTPVTGILLLILALTSFNEFSMMKENAEVATLSIFNFMGSIDQYDFLALTETLVSISFIATLIGMVISIIAFANYEKANGVIVLSSILLGLSIVLMALSTNTSANFYADVMGGSGSDFEYAKDLVRVGPSCISMLVFSILSLGAGIANKVITNKSKQAY